MEQERTPAEAFRDAVATYGSQSAAARALGRTQGAIWKVLHQNRPCPHDLVLLVEQDTGISRYVLRPDLYRASDLPAERTVGTGASIVPCDRRAGMQRGAA